jgi:ribosomal protein S14
MVIANFLARDIVRYKLTCNKAEYARFLQSVFNESRLFNSSAYYDLHTIGFKYTFFLSFKRQIHSAHSTLLRTRCLYNGRSRAVSSRYRMSRFAFKKLAISGALNGIRKASW